MLWGILFLQWIYTAFKLQVKPKNCNTGTKISWHHFCRLQKIVLVMYHHPSFICSVTLSFFQFFLKQYSVRRLLQAIHRDHYSCGHRWHLLYYIQPHFPVLFLHELSTAFAVDYTFLFESHFLLLSSRKICQSSWSSDVW